MNARLQGKVRAWGVGCCAALLVTGCATAPTALVPEEQKADDLMVVDCLLPGQVRQLGQFSTFLTARRPIKTTAGDCAIRGGEFTAFDRSDYATALKIWLPQAQSGDPEAQNYVGEIYEKGLGLKPDYEAAILWYGKAADQGFTRAQINLGNLYEKGLGVPRDPAIALNWYRRASGLDSDNLQYASTIVATETLQTQLSAAEAEVATLKAYKADTEAAIAAAKTVTKPVTPAPAPAPKDGPVIEVMDPPLSLTRSGPSVTLRNAVAEKEIIGKVETTGGIQQFYVNGQPVEVDEFDLFFATVPVTSSRTPVSLRAIDRANRQVNFDFTIIQGKSAVSNATVTQFVPEAEQLPAGVEFGRYYALVIGNNAYNGYAPLMTAVNDATEIARVLTERFGFNTKLITDATRFDILSALNELRQTLNDNDNLLIYYAGHGELDEANERGYWIPVDAQPNDTTNWLSNVSISDQLNTLKAKHVMVIADSCYAGTLSTASVARQNLGLSDADRTEWFKLMADIRARTVLTSGGVKPVLDAGSNGHSVFANALLNVLREQQGLLDGNSLYLSVLSDVRARSKALNFEQVPDYGAIKYAGHEAGEFFLQANDG